SAGYDDGLSHHSHAVLEAPQRTRGKARRRVRALPARAGSRDGAPRRAPANGASGGGAAAPARDAAARDGDDAPLALLRGTAAIPRGPTPLPVVLWFLLQSHR